jgi:hypothetical protein
MVESMTAAKFRSLALSLPEISESAHMGHPDFRVGGKIFATLGPDEDENFRSIAELLICCIPPSSTTIVFGNRCAMQPVVDDLSTKQPSTQR